jgi:predicted DNA-binding protein (MmcQ/YjbR family)
MPSTIPFEKAREIALSFDEVMEEPHFEITSFRVKKKIFMTMNTAQSHVTIRLSKVDQSIFCGYDARIIYPVASKWGDHGWTHINLLLVEGELLRDAITLSYCLAAPKKLAQKYAQPNGE